MDRANRELGLGFDEFGHGLGQSGEIALVHLIGVLKAVRGADEADVRKGIDAKEGETGLGLFELDVAEEDLGVGGGRRVLIVGDERVGDDGELFAEVLEVELLLVVELDGVEEDGERVGSGCLDGGEEAREGQVVQADHTRFRTRLEVEELGDSVGVGIGIGEDIEDQRRGEDGDEEDELG